MGDACSHDATTNDEDICCLGHAIYSPFLLPDCVVVAAAEALAGRMGATRYCEIEVWYFAAFSLSGDVRNCNVGLFSPGGYSKRNGRQKCFPICFSVSLQS